MGASSSNQITVNESVRRKYHAVEVMAQKLAHQTNNYYGIIQGYVSLLEMHLKDDKKLSDMLLPMKEAIHSGIQLNKRMAALYRTTSVMGAHVDMAAILDKVCTTFAQEHDFAIELATEGKVPPVFMDESALMELSGGLCMLAKVTHTIPARLELAATELDASAIAPMVLESNPGSYVRLRTFITLLDYPQLEETEFLNPFAFDIGEPDSVGLALLYATPRNHQGNLDLSPLGDGLNISLLFPLFRT